MIGDVALIPLLQGIVLGTGICCTLGPQSVFVEVSGLSERLEGKFRPGHFRVQALVANFRMIDG